MNLWKIAATTLVASLAFAFIVEFAPPEQKQMIMCAVMPNCVYVMGVQAPTHAKEQ